jgi:hypothetical protein
LPERSLLHGFLPKRDWPDESASRNDFACQPEICGNSGLNLPVKQFRGKNLVYSAHLGNKTELRQAMLQNIKFCSDAESGLKRLHLKARLARLPGAPHV